MTEKAPERQRIEAPYSPQGAMAEKQKTRPTLLGIAPELRNRIYYAALTSSELLDIKKPASRKEPALLSVGRQIREEAISIYYTDNNFSFECCRLDIYKVLPFCELQKRYHVDNKVEVQMMICNHPAHYFIWDNFRAWLQWYHKHPEETPRLTKAGTKEEEG